MDLNKEEKLTIRLIMIGEELSFYRDDTSRHRILNQWFRNEEFRDLLSEFCWETDLTDWEISDVTKKEQVSD